MHKIWASIKKETLLLLRDPGGIAILFVMPLVLLITITLIQDSTFKTVSDNQIPILIVNQDEGAVSSEILKGISDAKAFEIIQESSETEARTKVFDGEYQLAIVIPKNLSQELEDRVSKNVDGILAKMGLLESDSLPPTSTTTKEIRLYFDPATQSAFKSNVKNSIDKMISQIENQSIYKSFEEQLATDSEDPIFETQSFITYREILSENEDDGFIPNSVQHNVPAWSLFAIFFIIVPLSINIVKEKSQGTLVRLRTHPVSYATILAGKTIVYLVVCLIQFTLMLGIGIYLFPYIGLETLQVGDKLPLLYTVAGFAGLAAIGLGLLLGTVAKTHEQSAPFGATLVVILAAMGGVWVPVFIMPKFMQILSHISPMNWGLNAFYDVFLRQANFMAILPEISLLFLFFAATTIISVVYNEKRNII